MSEEQRQAAIVALGQALRREKAHSFILERVDDQPASQSSLLPALKAIGFSRVPKGYSWYG